MTAEMSERSECESLLGSIASGHPGALDQLRRWIQEQPGLDYSRARTLGLLTKDPRFAAALPVVGPLEQLLALGCSQNHVRNAARADVAAWLTAHPHVAAVRAAAILDLAVTTEPLRREWVTPAFVCMPFAGQVMPAWDPLIVSMCRTYRPEAEEASLLSALQRMPIERRDACFDRVIERGAAHRFTDAVLALASQAFLARLTEHRAAEAAERQRALDARRLAKGSAPFRFVEPAVVLLRDYDQLDAGGQAQYRATAASYLDTPALRDGPDFARRLEAHLEDAGDIEMRRWKVMRGPVHAYDLWVVAVDNGGFFEAGSAREIPVYIVQHNYVPRTEDEETAQLARDLELSEPVSLWPDT